MNNTEKDFKDGFTFCVKMIENFVYGTHSTHIETELLRNFILKLKKDKWQAYLHSTAIKRREKLNKNELL
jgi:hypothetical protein